MKYRCSIDINLPIEKVIELFDNTDNMKKWMEGLESVEHLSGTLGTPGAKSKLKFDMGKRKVEMIETVLVSNLPEEFSGTYDANGVHNIIKNRFEQISDNKTKYITDQEFQFKGMMKLMGVFMPGAFKKQTQKYLELFKNFAEKEAGKNNG